MWGLGFPAAWAVLVPSDYKLLKPALECTALEQQNEQQQDEVEKQGNVNQRRIVSEWQDSGSESYETPSMDQA
jgi:hypothetical protein